jgi:hypothetical protein
MNAQSTVIGTKEGQALVSTKSKWLYVFPIPHTTVMPYPCSATELKKLSSFIKWNTEDPATLSKLHESVGRWVSEIGAAGVFEVGNSVKMTARIAKTFGGTWQDILKEAAKDGAALPIPDDVVNYIKGFM